MDTAHGATTDKEIRDEIRENFRADCISRKRDQRKHERNRLADKGGGGGETGCSGLYHVIFIYILYNK